MRPGRVESNQRAAQCLCLSGSSDPGLGSCCWLRPDATCEGRCGHLNAVIVRSWVDKGHPPGLG